MEKAQASLDFLMTYGWALVLISIGVAAAISLGILDTGAILGSRAFGFSQVQPIGWSMDSSGALAIKLQNSAGTDINITSIRAAWGSASILNSTVVFIPSGGESGRLQLGAFQQQLSKGASYSINLVINYTDTEAGAGFDYSDSGTISGRAV